MGCRKVGREGEVTGRMIVDGAATGRCRSTWWTQGMWGGDSECSGVTQYQLGRLGDSVVLGGNSGNSVTQC